MIPTYRYLVSSPMPLDLNEDQSHQLFITKHQASSSSSSLSYSILFNPDQDQSGSYYLVEPMHLQSDEEAEKIITSRGSCDHPAVEKVENSSDLKLTVWKKEDGNENLQADEDGSVKWMSSKMRMMRRMMSLCNVCGIRQRKARRAMAAAAANGTILVAAEPSHMKGNKLHKKEKKSKIECATQLKKKHKLGAKPCRGRKKFGFEDLAISLSKNLVVQEVFPQDEKEAAILLMALSYGLLHGFPSDRYLDL